MKPLIAAVLVAAGIAGTPTPAIAQNGWTTMLLPGGVPAARTVLDLAARPDRVDEFLLADIANRFYGDGDGDQAVSTFRRYLTFLDQVTVAAAAWPGGLSKPTDATPRGDRDRAKDFLALLGLTTGAGGTVSAGTSSEARERRTWLAAAGVDTLEMVEPLNSGAAVAVTIPQGELPLPLPGFWKAIDSRQSPLLTIVSSRQSALFYAGLLSLDSETLQYLSAHPALSAQLRNRHADEFSRVARSIQIHGGRVVPAGGDGTTALWEKLAGTRLSSPEAFVPALLAADGGRLARYFDLVATLPADRRAWVLGTDGAQTYAVIRRLPLKEPALDPLTVLTQLDITEGSASPLLSWIYQRDEETRTRFEACRAAQRLIARTDCSTAALAELLDAAVHTPTLLHLFERLGITDAAVVSAAIRAARALEADGKDDSLRSLAQWQLMLALIEQVAVRQRWDSQKATTMVGLWAAGAATPEADDDGRAGEWLVDMLLPALAADVATSDLELYERDLIVALAKRDGSKASPVNVFWEGIEYVVDDTFATTRDVLTIRVSQQSPTVGDVVRLRAVIRKLESGPAGLATVAEIAADVTRVMAATAKLRARDGSEHEIAAAFRRVDKAIQQISSERQVSDAVAQVRQMRKALDALVQGALLPLVYALAVSPAGVSPSTLLEFPQWHSWENAAWQPARRSIGPFMESVISGSVIGLDVAMGASRLRAAGRVAVSEKRPAEAESPELAILRSLRAHSEGSAWVGDAPRIVKALAAGAAEIAASGEIALETEARMRAAGIAPDRIAMVRWQRERGVPAERQAFTRLDAYRLGTRDPLPSGWTESDPLTEVMLRLVDGTQSWKLPAGVVPALVPLAAHDWLIQKRAVTRDRIETYMLGLVSARLLMRPVRSQHP